jgi:hypothetical protein
MIQHIAPAPAPEAEGHERAANDRSAGEAGRRDASWLQDQAVVKLNSR